MLQLLACTAFHLPDLPAARPAELAAPLGPAVIAPLIGPERLSKDDADAFVSRLRDDLVATGLFDSVEIGDAANGAIVIRPEWGLRGQCFAEPMLTVLTVGLIPYPGCYFSGYHFTLSGPRFPRDVVVDNRAKLTFLWGWVAGPIGLLPGWSLQSPEEREQESLRLSILSAAASGTTP
jgi:hypothetical protein